MTEDTGNECTTVSRMQEAGMHALWGGLYVVYLPTKEVFQETSRARFASKGGWCGQQLFPVTLIHTLHIHPLKGALHNIRYGISIWCTGSNRRMWARLGFVTIRAIRSHT